MDNTEKLDMKGIEKMLDALIDKPTTPEHLVIAELKKLNIRLMSSILLFCLGNKAPISKIKLGDEVIGRKELAKRALKLNNELENAKTLQDIVGITSDMELVQKTLLRTVALYFETEAEVAIKKRSITEELSKLRKKIENESETMSKLSMDEAKSLVSIAWRVIDWATTLGVEELKNLSQPMGTIKDKLRMLEEKLDHNLYKDKKASPVLIATETWREIANMIITCLDEIEETMKGGLQTSEIGEIQEALLSPLASIVGILKGN